MLTDGESFFPLRCFHKCSLPSNCFNLHGNWNWPDSFLVKGPNLANTKACLPSAAHTHTHQVLTKHCVWANIFPTKKSYGTLKPNIFFTQPCARLLSERVEGKMPETEIYLFFFSFFVFLDLSLGFLFDSSFLVLLPLLLGFRVRFLRIGLLVIVLLGSPAQRRRWVWLWQGEINIHPAWW